jgi:hypothetical protein
VRFPLKHSTQIPFTRRQINGQVTNTNSLFCGQQFFTDSRGLMKIFAKAMQGDQQANDGKDNGAELRQNLWCHKKRTTPGSNPVATIA